MRKIKKIENTIHHDIFYPSSKEVLEDIIQKEELNYKSNEVDNSKVVILPHASYEFILPLLVNTFTSINDNFEKIIIIAPSHLNKINGDSTINLFAPEYDAINTPLGVLDFDSELLSNNFSPLMRNNTYFEEESSFEQLYIMVKHYFRDKTVLPICAVINSSTDSKNFSTFLNKIIDDKTLIIISGNASSYQKQDISYKKANQFIKALENGEKLLQLQKKNIIDSCASGIIDSIVKTKLYKNCSWDIKLVEVEKQISKNITNEGNYDKCVYHISAKIKEK